MSKRRRKQALQRAQGIGQPSGSVVIPSSQLSQMMAQLQYQQMTQVKNKGSQGQALFSPGVPLETQPGTSPKGLPLQFRFPIAWNTSGPSRSMGDEAIPSFEQLRNLAKLYSGITMCERAWYDMVPRMGIKISLRPDLVAQGAEERTYQKQISFFQQWFEHPGANKQEDIHTWLRRALREQTQIDELYIYKRQTRGKGLYSLDVLAGDQFKPLLDDWGMIPQPPLPAYQQYPWGIPGEQFTTLQMIHYQESPAADRPYGFSRVERVMMEVNQALRKKKRDLAMFTEGNIPAAIAEVPGDTQWTPDQIDAFEQMWNALIAGNPQQQVRVRFTMPGMKFTKLDNGEIMTDFDLFLLRITCGAYGLSVNDLAFTDNANYSTSDNQENVMYRRTLQPLASIYAKLLTNVMQHDFPPELKGELFILEFSGYEEESDVGALATAYSTLTNAGILGLTDAAKLMNLPEPADAPYVGRIILGKSGPVFLDDLASKPMREAAMKAQLAGFEMAANPPEQQPAQGDQPAGKPASPASDDEEDDEEAEKPSSPPQKKKQPQRDLTSEIERLLERLERRLIREEEIHESRAPKETEERASPQSGLLGGGPETAIRATTAVIAQDDDALAKRQETSREWRRWRGRALDDMKAGKPLRGFTTTLLPQIVHGKISRALERCTTVDQVRLVFTRADDAAALDEKLEYYPELDAWQPKTLYQQLEEMKARGVKYLRWKTHPGSCDACTVADGEKRAVGQPFSNNALLPKVHPNCECEVEEVMN